MLNHSSLQRFCFWLTCPLAGAAECGFQSKARLHGGGKNCRFMHNSCCKWPVVQLLSFRLNFKWRSLSCGCGDQSIRRCSLWLGHHVHFWSQADLALEACVFLIFFPLYNAELQALSKAQAKCFSEQGSRDRMALLPLRHFYPAPLWLKQIRFSRLAST